MAVDAAIHASHREGDQHKHHAITHILSAEELTDKTRILDAASSGGPETEAMHEVWAEMQIQPLRWQGRLSVSIIGHWRCSAKVLSLDEVLKAEELDREPELKLGGHVRKGERSSTVVKFGTVEREDENGEERQIPYARAYRVFNADQIEGLAADFHLSPLRRLLRHLGA